jgi:glycogen debranching enzyme
VNSDDTLPRGTVHIFRLQFLREASCYQHIRLLNYDRQPVRVSLLLQFDADFADIFEVRGTKRARKGERLPDQVEGDVAILAYEGLDGVVRRTRLEFSPRPASLTTREAHFQITLEPNEEKSIFSTVSCEQNPGGKSLDPFHTAFRGVPTENAVGANAFEISNIQEDETEATRARRSECNNVTLPLNGSMEFLRTTMAIFGIIVLAMFILRSRTRSSTLQ